MPRDTSDPLKTDLRLEIDEDGTIDLADAAGADTTVSGRDNLVQALTLCLLVARGELGELGHRRYGSRVSELVGEPLTAPNLALLRRHVRAALLQDARVAEIVRVQVRARDDLPGAVDVHATVRATTGDTVGVALALDLR
ncbi:hypothetical protein [Nannocystis sp.]|jgi:phage baseplate assembly protein W|uniref:hypothetical protein n=1 Tax=Nannocystis sp. TaxID=1962667 RepID=UPI002421092C|nr:hypothetical protein [Nannocystis sp.]MBK7827035.1 DUF2634 domain-containing protein [Nannocystis sp.]MBK9755937.1 DUF2634 domain-containing protein [Nannocystis sp.]